MAQNSSIEQKALIKAAKLICDLKSGLCPVREPDFHGCPHALQRRHQAVAMLGRSSANLQRPEQFT